MMRAASGLAHQCSTIVDQRRLAERNRALLRPRRPETAECLHTGKQQRHRNANGQCEKGRLEQQLERALRMAEPIERDIERDAVGWVLFIQSSNASIEPACLTSAMPRLLMRSGSASTKNGPSSNCASTVPPLPSVISGLNLCSRADCNGV